MLYLAIPTYNEVATIGVLLWRLRTVLTEFPREYEVVVYDDASSDETATVAEQYREVMPVVVLRGREHLGYSGATNALLKYVAGATRYPKRDAVLLMQGDFTDPPSMVPEFARHFEGGADLVVGERSVVADAPKSVKRLFKAAHWALRPFVRVEGVSDLTASMRLMRITALRDAIRATDDAPLLEGDSWSANADLLLHLAPYARRVESVPVEPTYGVRQRGSRRIAMRDALALLRWAWRSRGQRVLVGSATHTGDSERRERHHQKAAASAAVIPRERKPDSPRERPTRERKSRDKRSRSEQQSNQSEDERPALKAEDSDLMRERLRLKIRTREGTQGLEEAPPRRERPTTPQRPEYGTPSVPDALADVDPFADPFASPAQRRESAETAPETARAIAPSAAPTPTAPLVWTPPTAEAPQGSPAAKKSSHSPTPRPEPTGEFQSPQQQLPPQSSKTTSASALSAKPSQKPVAKQSSFYDPSFDLDPFADPTAGPRRPAPPPEPTAPSAAPNYDFDIDPFADPTAGPRRVVAPQPQSEPQPPQQYQPRQPEPAAPAYDLDPFADPFAPRSIAKSPAAVVPTQHASNTRNFVAGLSSTGEPRPNYSAPAPNPEREIVGPSPSNEIISRNNDPSQHANDIDSNDIASDDFDSVELDAEELDSDDLETEVESGTDSTSTDSAPAKKRRNRRRRRRGKNGRNSASASDTSHDTTSENDIAEWTGVSDSRPEAISDDSAYDDSADQAIDDSDTDSAIDLLGQEYEESFEPRARKRGRRGRRGGARRRPIDQENNND